jgi:hypothetical protein
MARNKKMKEEIEHLQQGGESRKVQHTWSKL